LQQKDAEKKKHSSKTYVMTNDEEDQDYGVWWNEDDETPGQQGEDEEEPTENEAWFEAALAAVQEQPEDEQVLANFQEAKKAFYKDARRALDQHRVNRGFYPTGKGKGKGEDKGKQEAPFKGKCMRCGKVGHKAYQCPQGGKGQKGGGKGTGVGFIYTTWSKTCPNETDTLGAWTASSKPQTSKAIMDCGASESIVGACTLQKLHDELEHLGFDPEQEIDMDRSLRKSFIFGNNQTSQALGKATVTSGLAGAETTLEVHVVEGKTPFLLSSKWLYDQEAVIDFRRGQAWLPKISSEIIQLERSPTYHLLLPLTAFAGNEEIAAAAKVTSAETSPLLRACLRMKSSDSAADQE
jgi:hypothetical protein